MRLADKVDAYPGELSGGQQQRVAIARGLAMRPEIMLFDEVTAALDPETVKEVLVTIREVAEEGMTCILVTHEMGFAREVADHVYFTDHGVIVEHGPPAEFFAHAREARTREIWGRCTRSESSPLRHCRHCERSEAIQGAGCETLSGLLRRPSGASQ